MIQVVTKQYEVIKNWNKLYTRELSRTIYSFKLAEQIREGFQPMVVWWSVQDCYCLLQGMIYTKPMWNMHPYEEKCHNCMLYNSMCRFRTVVK